MDCSTIVRNFNALSKSLRILVIAVVLAITSSCSKSPSYLGFMNRPRTFHEGLADACEQLAASVKATKKMNGADVSLPPMLLGLNARSIEVDTNGVFIEVGVGRGAYGISWSRNERDPSVWELETAAENQRKVILSRKDFVPNPPVP